MLIYKIYNLVKFSFEYNLVILEALICGDIWCVSKLISSMRLKSLLVNQDLNS